MKPSNAIRAQKRTSKTDDLPTPPEVYEVLRPHIRGLPRIWEPCAGDGYLAGYMKDDGHTVIETDIRNGIEQDVRHCPPPAQIHAIVTNPPFSIKQAVFVRLVDLGIPFALLMPVQTVCVGWFRDHLPATTVIPVTGHPRFVGQKQHAPFYVAWFTQGLT